MRTCEEYEALISAFIDGALEDGDRELNVRFVKMPDGTGEDSQDGTE